MLSREWSLGVGNELRDSLEGHRRGWFAGVIPILMPCWQPAGFEEQPSPWFGSATDCLNLKGTSQAVQRLSSSANYPLVCSFRGWVVG